MAVGEVEGKSRDEVVGSLYPSASSNKIVPDFSSAFDDNVDLLNM